MLANDRAREPLTEQRRQKPAALRDSYGRTTSAADPLGHTTSYSYDSGLLKTVTDPLGNVTTLLYDSARRQVGALVGMRANAVDVALHRAVERLRALMVSSGGPSAAERVRAAVGPL